jgi:hypothetical protein
METLVNKLNELTMSHFQCSVKNFIEQGVKKGRHYFYLRDALGLTDKKFLAVMDYLEIDKEKVIATMQDYYKLFEEPEITEEESEEEEDIYAY